MFDFTIGWPSTAISSVTYNGIVSEVVFSASSIIPNATSNCTFVTVIGGAIRKTPPKDAIVANCAYKSIF